MDSIDVPVATPHSADHEPVKTDSRPRWLALAGLGIAVLAVWAWVQGGPTQLLLACAVLAVLLAIAAALALGYRRGLTALHRAVNEARAGHLVPVDASPAVRTLLGPVIDDYNAMSKDLASAFREMEHAQRSIIGERNRHDAILQSLPGALLIVGADRRVTRANRQVETMFRAPHDHIVGADFLALMGLEGGSPVLDDAFGSAEPVRNLVCEVRVGHETRLFSVNLTFFSQPGEPADSSAAVILQDVTETRRVEEMTLQTEKLVAMGELAGGVAHELNTPLGTILGYAHLLLEGRADESRRAEFTRIIHEQARRCARIVDDLLTYARRPSCEPESADLNELICEARDAVANCQGRRLGVPLSALLSESITVRGGAGQLDIVLINLLVNATQAAALSAEPRVQISCDVEGDFAVVTVTDNGPGVPPELRRKIFDPFFTSKRDGGGTGLGLALSHSIVTRIGGMLDCDPSHRGGARFLLRLPLVTRG